MCSEVSFFNLKTRSNINENRKTFQKIYISYVRENYYSYQIYDQ